MVKEKMNKLNQLHSAAQEQRREINETWKRISWEVEQLERIFSNPAKHEVSVKS